ncbi:uncharacterized protein LOC126409461, partial [Nymphaea colorata]|uniref:uncharacterized protein LOC126409461 n=1 Tax=Nymphaea colorata TaxID=210225 RepID=UPI00214E1F0F
MKRLLHILGWISQKDMHKYEKEAKQQGKGSFAYAWALDESVEERERGITMAVAVARFESRKFHVVMLDSPGLKDFVANVISGATQTDADHAVILVVDASIGSLSILISADDDEDVHCYITDDGEEDVVIELHRDLDAVTLQMKEELEFAREKIHKSQLELERFRPKETELMATIAELEEKVSQSSKTMSKFEDQKTLKKNMVSVAGKNEDIEKNCKPVESLVIQNKAAPCSVGWEHCA